MSRGKKGHLLNLVLIAVAMIFTIALVLYPEQGFAAGISGLKVFGKVVFPSLLPFFVLAEILMGLGVVRGLGVLLEPLMRPLFSVPGVGAFALSMGLAAGYPMDAVIASRFRETGQCTRVEGERLLAFTNTADPLFMLSAVAVGMFKSPAVGGLLAVSHYISAFLVGVCFKFWGRKDKDHLAELQARKTERTNGSIFIRAYREMMLAREEDGRPFGKLLGNAVTESMQTLIMICGFIVFFAVFIEILSLSGMMSVIGAPIALVYHVFHINGGLVNPTIAGLLELDIGSAQTAVLNAPMLQKLALVSGIIGWSGLAVHAQVASVLTNTDIRMLPYFLARFLQAIFAAAATVVLYLMGMGRVATEAMAHVPALTGVGQALDGHSFWVVSSSAIALWLAIVAGLLVVSMAVGVLRRVRVIAFHTRLK
ncbi:sporulation integral membrane protein YlbJ [Alicyclobacillus fastidiosus]|uniref:Sporulation integral membrane protein YlbJ n=1 Tax=Alicyclobacillus fastidiosus TaxID=392011 RepID=A0ABY6ZA96_9BACL|nr:sporulation integral membrane protein YlbJ [Alicyclobacillus fastidiosus]WAH39673.1 sporulation integral membrane protein YlbJ [Alicyclobacillus fastidiosus]GMA60884.1 sporulation integral membrane protein YlbJ [Alicyclobacillus fastidiosus]